MTETVDREAATVPAVEEEVNRNAATVDPEDVNRVAATREDPNATVPKIIFYYDTFCDKKLLKGIQGFQSDSPLKVHVNKSTVFGRGTESVDIFLNDETASRRHNILRAFFDEVTQCMKYEMENISDSKKVFINGKGLIKGQKHILKDNDRVSVGKLSFVVAIINGDEKEYCLVAFEPFDSDAQRPRSISGASLDGTGMPAVITGIQNITIGGAVNGNPVVQQQQPIMMVPQMASFHGMAPPGQHPINVGPQGPNYGFQQQPMNFGPNQPMNYGSNQMSYGPQSMGGPHFMPHQYGAPVGPQYPSYMPSPGGGPLSFGGSRIAQESLNIVAQEKRNAFRKGGREPSENEEGPLKSLNISVEESKNVKERSFEDTHPPKK